MTSDMVTVDEMCWNTNALWAKYVSEGRLSEKCNLMRLDTPLRLDAVRIVCISDIHDMIASVAKRIPNGDILLCAGDLTQNGNKENILEFNKIMGELPHRYKVVIAGNHDLGFQDDFNLTDEQRDPTCQGKDGTPGGYKLLTNCVYLQDSAITILGLKIYGSSWHPLPGFPFSLCRGQQLLDKWNLIPADTDILITHTPPLGHNDVYNVANERWGCSELLNTVEKRVHPQLHVFGHVHEKNGMTTNGETLFVNASICNHKLEPVNDPIIVDIPKKCCRGK